MVDQQPAQLNGESLELPLAVDEQGIRLPSIARTPRKPTDGIGCHRVLRSTCDAFTQQALAVFSREGDKLAGGIWYRKRHRREIVAARVFECPVHDRSGTCEVDPQNGRR
jgi:hypothetical protein